jgi:hypothetical protein
MLFNFFIKIFLKYIHQNELEVFFFHLVFVLDLILIIYLFGFNKILLIKQA